MNSNITGTIVQLNEYPPDKFNVLIPVTTCLLYTSPSPRD